MELTKEQLAICEFAKYGTGHGIVNAVAGSGKTSTLLHIATALPPDSRILFCAFNKAIGKEIAHKLAKQGQTRIDVKTIHALGYKLLKQHQLGNNRISYLKYEQLTDRFISNELNWLVEEFAQTNSTSKKQSMKQVKNIMLQINNRSRSALVGESMYDFQTLFQDSHVSTNTTDVDSLMTSYFEANELLEIEGVKLAVNQGILDFKDMTFLPNQLDIYPRYKYDFIFIDECQDLSVAQLETALRFLRKNGRILAVGDTHQSIYAFMGADPESFNKVATRLEALSTRGSLQRFNLSTCFRCPLEVIKLASQYRNDMVAYHQRLGKVHYIQFSEIGSLIKANDLVIARKKELLLQLASTLSQNNWNVHLGSEIQQKSVSRTLNSLKGSVKLSTIHGAKGLEADRVFILDYDVLPINRESMQDWEIQQEENLFYVALTRAKNILFLVSSS